MLFLKKNPVGIDRVIDLIQKNLDSNVTPIWGSLDVYARVYKLQGKNNISLERYIGNGEYQKVLFSEGNKVFFIQGDKPEYNHGFMLNDLHIVCIVNMDKISKNFDRTDEESHFDIMNSLSKTTAISSIEGLEYGMDNLKNLVESSFDIGNFKYSDIHPYHVFIVKTKVNYEIINNC